MEIVHWEYNEALLGKDDNHGNKMTAGVMRNSDTDKITGVWFRWTYLIKSGNEVVLHCVGQDKYKVHDIQSFTIQDMTLTYLKSFENFHRVFIERMDLINIEVPLPVYNVQEEHITSLLNELKS